VAHTILLVDDEYASLEAFALLLAKEGYQISTASDGEEALVRMREKRPDLVISDYWMPKMDGLELCRRMQEDVSLRSIPLLLMTAALDSEIPRIRGLVGVLPKPIPYLGVLMTIRELLAEKRR
jgi:adenylate cyclase